MRRPVERRLYEREMVWQGMLYSDDGGPMDDPVMSAEQEPRLKYKLFPAAGPNDESNTPAIRIARLGGPFLLSDVARP